MSADDDDRRVLVPTGHVFAVPPHVALCPYCGAKLVARANCWAEVEVDSKRWEAESIDLECESEPDIDEDEWPEWDSRHSAMPYVYWLPAEQTVLRWINRCYRFDVEA